MSKTDKLRQTYAGSKSDTLRLWAIDFLEQINTAVGGGGGSALATEATLISVLNAIVASDQDIEILLVRDTVTLIVYQQITDYTSGVPVVTYKDVNGTPFVPVNPMEYLDPSAVMNLMLTELIAINASTTPIASIPTGLDVIVGAGAATVVAGKRTVSFMNTGDANTTVNGTTLKAGIAITYPELANGDTYAAIPYDALTSELTITTVG